MLLFSHCPGVNRSRRHQRPQHRRLALEPLEDRCLPSGGINEFLVPTANSGPSAITAGPGGNLWFTEQNPNKIARMTTSGTVNAEFQLPAGQSRLISITAGPDGNLWFTEDSSNLIGRMTPTGSISEFTVPTANSAPSRITAGPDGNLWFTEQGGNKIGRITPAGSITEFSVPTANSQPTGITAGPDGNLWFTEFAASASKIGRITPAGSITENVTPTGNSWPYGITAGPDGNLWFTELNTNKIGRVTTSVSGYAEFTIPTANSGPRGIAAGSDGNLWFAETNGNKIGRITTDGGITEFPVPTANSGLGAITAGPDGNLWFVESNANKIGQLVLDQPLTATGTTISPTARVPFSNVVVASFSDADPLPGPASSYSALITWGDGSLTYPGTITDNGGGNFDVSGSHTYTAAGSYAISVLIFDKDTSHDIGGSTTRTTSGAQVAALQSGWTTLSPMPTARANLMAASIGGTLYTVGGGDNTGGVLATLEAYDAASDTWSTKASMPALDFGDAGRYSGSVGLIDGKLYVVGGWRKNPLPLPTSSLEVYDPATNTWSTKASMPHLSGGSVAGVINRKLYVLTADDGFTGYRKFLDVYDPDSNTWTSKADAPNVHEAGAGGVINGLFYVVGGFDGSVISNTLDVYNPASNTWTTKAGMPTARQQLAGGVINGQLYAVGGWDGSSNLNTLEVYDPASNTWTTADSMPTARNGLAAGVIGNTLYAVGGGDSTGVLANLEAFTVPSGGPFAPGAIPPGLGSPTAGTAAVSGNTPYAVAGSDGTNIHSPLETVTPNSGSPAGPALVWWSMPDDNLPQGRQVSDGSAGGEVPAGLQFMPLPAASVDEAAPVLSARLSADQLLDSGGLSPALIDLLAMNLLI